jgi:uncharacterized protein
MNAKLCNLGLGIGWRPELALFIDRCQDLGFVEILAEDFDPALPIPPAIDLLRRRGLSVIPHGVALSLGSAEPPEKSRLTKLARLAEKVQAPLVSEHLAFVRGGGLETGYLLPLMRTAEAFDIVVATIQMAQAALPVPLALENIATLLEWPNPEMDEAEFLIEIFRRTNALLLLDVENLYANARNHGGDPLAVLDRLPLDRLAYVHVAGGCMRNGLYHDTHAVAVPQPVLDLLEELCRRVRVPGVLLERDDDFPTNAELQAELDAIAQSMRQGAAQREATHAGR